MSKRKLLPIVLALVMIVTLVQPTYAKTKYTKTEKNIAMTLANFQEEDLVDPDSFKIKKVREVKYVLNEDIRWLYKEAGIYKDYKTIKWAVDFTAKNSYGGRVKNTIYISSTYCYFADDGTCLEDYDDCTNHYNKTNTKKLTKHVKTLAKKYYEAM